MKKGVVYWPHEWREECSIDLYMFQFNKVHKCTHFTNDKVDKYTNQIDNICVVNKRCIPHNQEQIISINTTNRCTLPNTNIILNG